MKAYQKRKNIVYWPLSCMCMYMSMCVCVFSHIWLFANPWSVTHLSFLSLGFSSQENWCGLPFPTPLSQKWEVEWKLYPYIFLHLFQGKAIHANSLLQRAFLNLKVSFGNDNRFIILWNRMSQEVANKRKRLTSRNLVFVTIQWDQFCFLNHITTEEPFLLLSNS